MLNLTLTPRATEQLSFSCMNTHMSLTGAAGVILDHFFIRGFSFLHLSHHDLHGFTVFPGNGKYNRFTNPEPPLIHLTQVAYFTKFLQCPDRSLIG